ncbi:MAG TPA: alpha/beta fold hydrolase [Candidatus Acidoferrum sp.]|nr:alpha/beta fold hydrolase [Candidatus Acidoferrum sp.]
MSEPAAMSGRDLLEAALRGGSTPPPYFQLLGMRLIMVGDGTATLEMPATSNLYNPNNIVHGGAVSSLADSAMGLAVFSTCGPGENFTTAELHINFLKPATAQSGTLRAVGRVVQRGQQVVVAEAEVVDQRSQPVARAGSTLFILQRREGAPVLTAAQVAAPEPVPVETQPIAAVPPMPGVPPIAVAVPMAPPMPIPPPPSPEPPPERMPTPSVSPPLTTEPIIPAPLARTKRKVRTFAGDVAYIRQGQGPALVLLHGIPSSSYLWRDVIVPLAATFDVLAPDLLGYGDSDKRLDADLSIAAQARYMVAVMESLGIHQAAVVGHDIGGGIAQLMAVDEPQRVARLILIDSVVDNNWPVPDIARLKEPVWDQIMVNRDLRSGLRKGLEAGIVTPERVTDELVDEWTRPFQDLGGRRAYLRAARALNNRDLTSRAKHIEQIEIPTLILWGADDKFLEPRWADTLKHKWRDTTVELIEPGGHFLPLDRPDAVADAILRFLTTR